MAFERYQVIVIFGDGTQQRSIIPASSASEAEAKTRAGARGSAASHQGIEQVLVDLM